MVAFDVIKVHPLVGATRRIISSMQLQGHGRVQISGIICSVRPTKIPPNSSESRH